jgi:hypothetical protein
VLDESASWLYLVALLALAAAGILHGVWFGRFAFLAYGIIYGYIGISAEILRARPIESTFALTYVIVSGVAVVGFIVFLARLFGREE